MCPRVGYYEAICGCEILTTGPPCRKGVQSPKSIEAADPSRKRCTELIAVQVANERKVDRGKETGVTNGQLIELGKVAHVRDGACQLVVAEIAERMSRGQGQHGRTRCQVH